MTIKRKRGQLGLDEEKFIRENYGSLTIEQIADQLNRTPEPVKRYIKENNLTIINNDEELKDNEILRQKLYSKTFWLEIKRQFDEDSGELRYFEDTWIGLIKQFREDVLPAEELQIKQFITIDILINRSMKERKRHISETEKLQRLVDKEYEKSEEERDIPKLANLETQLSFARNSIANYTNEYTKLLNEQQKISKDLKATREQRIKRIEDGKSSWIGLIRMLEDEDTREKEGKRMEILALATDKAKETLFEYHTYQDNVVDKPFLTSESIE
jgi:predicted transcriptional regulator